MAISDIGPIAGHLSPEWAQAMGLRAGIPCRLARSMRTGTRLAGLPRRRCGERCGHVDLHHRDGHKPQLVLASAALCQAAYIRTIRASRPDFPL